MARPVGTASISFGLVNIPVKLFAATGSKSVGFNMLHKACGSRIQQRMHCPVHDVTVERDGIVRGYEYAKNQYVTFSEEELQALEVAHTNTIELLQFVPAESIDLLYIESTHYLGANGSGKAYQLLARAMDRSQRIGVGRRGTRGKDYLVLIRPYKNGLILHEAFYADEVRSFEEAVDVASLDIDPLLAELTDKMIEQMSSDRFDASKYEDNWRKRIEQVVEQKAAGHQLTVQAAPPNTQIIDLLEALKRSVLAKEGMRHARPGPAKTQAPKKTPPATKRSR